MLGFLTLFSAVDAGVTSVVLRASGTCAQPAAFCEAEPVLASAVCDARCARGPVKAAALDGGLDC